MQKSPLCCSFMSVPVLSMTNVNVNHHQQQRNHYTGGEGDMV